MNRELAEELTQGLGQSVSGAWRTIAALQKAGVPKALNLTPEAWVKNRLGGYIQLAVAERYEAARELQAAGHSTRQIGAALGVDNRTVRRDLNTEANAAAGRKKGQQQRAKGVTTAANAAVPLDAFAGLAVSEDAREAQAREANRQERRERQAVIKEERGVPPHPSGTFLLIYADPPWRYEHVKTESRAIENQYPTMDLEAICADKPSAAEDAVLFLWATSPKLTEALRVMDAWGFAYRTCAVWDKEQIGMGYYFRQQHELLLVGARGNAPIPDPETRLPSLFRSKRSEHSEKPSFMYGYLEAMYPAFRQEDRLELYSREARVGWTQRSNEP